MIFRQNKKKMLTEGKKVSFWSQYWRVYACFYTHMRIKNMSTMVILENGFTYIKHFIFIITYTKIFFNYLYYKALSPKETHKTWNKTGWRTGPISSKWVLIPCCRGHYYINLLEDLHVVVHYPSSVKISRKKVRTERGGIWNKSYCINSII